MNVTLSKRGDYVVRAALCLAKAYASGEQRKIREIVAEMDIPQTYASQILAELVHVKLATSRAGKDGGYQLTSDPKSVSLLSVIEAGEGPLRSERCALGDGPCRWNDVCPLHETWVGATAALRSALEQTTLADLVERDLLLEAGKYEIPEDAHRQEVPKVDINDWVHVETDATSVDHELNASDHWLQSCVKAAYLDADTLRQSLEPTGTSWVPRIITVAAETPSTLRSDLERELIWKVQRGNSGPESSFEGILTLTTIDPKRTELRLTGSFTPPRTATQSSSNHAEQLSRATIRSLLREMSRRIESGMNR